MGASTYTNGIQAAVAGGANFDIRPAVGHAYCIEEIGSDVVFVGDVPDVSVALRDGVHADAVVRIDPTTAVQKGNRAFELYIDRDTYLRITNTAAGAANISWLGRQVNPALVQTQIVTAPNGGTVDVRPAAGHIWKVFESGCETMGANNRPNVTIYLTDGVLVASALCDETHNLRWDDIHGWILSNDIFIRIAPIAAADNDVGLSMMEIPGEAFSGITDVAGAATLDIRPAVGYQCVITGLAGETWAGIAPVGSPDMTVSVWDGVTLSDLAEAGSVSDSLLNNRTMALRIDRDIWIRVTDVSGGNNEIAYCGYVERIYSP